MSSIPDNLQYTKEHEWVLATGNIYRMGITDYAQGALGDIVYVQLPKIGENVTADKVCGEVTGKIVAVNDSLGNAPETINSDPYGAGWLADIEVAAPVDGLLSAAEYRQITA
jgi:glycine cleavage system H protein